MKRIIGIVLIGALTASLISGCSPVVADPAVTSETASGFSSRPQDDFYYYVNKDRLDNAEFEYGASYAASAFDPAAVKEQIETVIKDVVAGSGYEKGSEEYVIQTAYNAYMDYDFENEPVPEDLKAVINEVMNAESAEELMMLDARICRDYGVTGYLNFMVSDSSFAEGENILFIVPFRGVAGAEFEDVREDNTALNSIVTNIRTYMITLGKDADSASGYGRSLANLVLKIYGSTDLEAMDASYDTEYEKICSLDELKSIFTNVDIMEYFKTIGFDEQYCGKFCIYDKGQLECINSIMTDENLDALKAWEIYDIYNEYILFIAPSYTELRGFVPVSYDSREDQAIALISKVLDSETDPIYVERYYSKETDDALRAMCDDIKEGYRGVISSASWLTEATRQGLLEKLDNIVYVTATDLKRHDNSKYADLGGNFYELNRDYRKKLVAGVVEQLSQPVDRYGIEMTMQTVNACYIPTRNNITITAAITNKPYFDAKADYYTNLGGLGATIAHEMGHAFDSNCILFDKNGIYDPDWIAAEDLKALEDRNQQAASYFEDNFTVFGIYHVDGERTLGENYADLSGMEVIVSLAKTDDDLKKLFESYAESWCCMRVDVSIMSLLFYDVHCPEVIRVNAILSTLDCFYDVYDVKEGDGMYIAPENRISRWH